MPERDAVQCNLGDGYLLIAAGVRREKTSELTADLMLQNGSIVFADRGVLNTPEGRLAWASRAHTPDGPTAERMADALLKQVLPEAMGRLQEAEPKKASQADLLVGMVSDLASDVAEAVELFHDPGGAPYATVSIGGHRETWPLHSKGFRQWTARHYHEKYGKTPNAQALADAMSVLAGKAVFDGPEHEVHLRIAEHEGAVYLDLCNDHWEAVEIDRSGWRIVADPPVKFRRTRGMLALPTPARGGSLDRLRQFINVPRGDAGDAGDASPWILAVAWLIAAFRPHGPYPVLVVLGEQGSAKSTLLRMLRALIDPNKAPIRSLPRDERDLMIARSNSWAPAFDNLSSLQDWQSDALCRISTGGGPSTRELYSDQDEMIFDAQRPLSLNGIEDVVTRNDLLDRSLMAYLREIPEERRQPEKQLWRTFEDERPHILGAVLDAVATGLAREDAVKLAEHPRMADFAAWIVAAEPALPWKPGAFLDAYSNNRVDANDLTLEASPVAQAVRDFMQERGEPWTGSATELLTELEGVTTEKIRKLKTWPTSGQTLSGVLRRLAPNLRAAKVDVTFGRSGRKRVIHIEQRDNEASQASQASHGAQDGGFSGDARGDACDASGGDPGEQASPSWQQDPMNWRGTPGDGDACDACDASSPSHSDWEAGVVCLHCGDVQAQGQARCLTCGEELAP